MKKSAFYFGLHARHRQFAPFVCSCSVPIYPSPVSIHAPPWIDLGPWFYLGEYFCTHQSYRCKGKERKTSRWAAMCL